MLAAMDRAFSTLGCPQADLPTAAALAQRHHVNGLELRALGGTVDLPSYFIAEFGTPARFAVAARRLGIRLVSLDTSLHLADANTDEREKFLGFVPWAEAAGIRWLRVFEGGAALSASAAIAAAASAVQWWRALRAERGYRVDIMVETHDRFFTAAIIEEFAVAAPHTAILWDSHHTWKRGSEDPVVTWRAIQQHVVHIHVKDSASAPPPAPPFQYVLPGAGEFPMAPLRSALFADHFTGTVSLEWERMWHPALAPLDDALHAAAAHRWW